MRNTRDKLIDVLKNKQYKTLMIVVMIGDAQMAEIKTGVYDSVWYSEEEGLLRINKNELASNYDAGFADFNIEISEFVAYDSECDCYCFDNHGINFMIFL